MKFSDTPAEIRSLPPGLGEHSVEVLLEAGYSEAEVAEMLAQDVIVDGRAETTRSEVAAS